MNKTLLPSIFLKSVFGILFIFLFGYNCQATDYYVNDNDTTSDVHCTAVGNVGNDGLTAAFPKATLTQILTTYSGVLTSGDVIYVDAGIYYQTDIAINITVAGLTIQGAGTLLTLFDNSGHGGTQEYFMRVLANDVNLVNFTVTGYDYDPGGRGKAITVSGATGVVVDGVNTIDNYNNGDAAFMVTSNSEVTILNGASSCNAGTYGGGYRIEGRNITVLFNNSIVAQNSITLENGGGIYISGDNGAASNITITIQNSSIQQNSAVRGGGIFIENANLTASNSCFDSNAGVAVNDGGGAIYVGDNCTVTLNNCSFTNNTANPSSADGGAISVVAQNTSVNIQQCSFTGNTANDDGNAIYLDRSFSGAAATIAVNESIFGLSQTVFRRTGDGASSSLTVTNSGPRQPGPGSDPIAGNNIAQSLGAPATSCPAVSNPCNVTILPVEFLDFTIACEGENTQFNWSTASERNNDYFILEYSNDFVNWNQVVREKGKGTTQLRSDYTVELENAQSGYYKLSQRDTDGKVNELKTAFIRNCAKGFTVYPNPTHDEVTISLVGYDKNVTIQVYNAVGVLVYEKDIRTENELYSGRISLSELASGAYIIRASDGLNNSQQKIIKN